MKKPHLSLLFLFLISASLRTGAQGTAATLDVVSWNVEWFGSPQQSPADDNLQEHNVRTILRSINADIYGLVEVVDTARLRRLTDSLGPQYRYVISPYSSSNSTGTGPTWLNAQKLAYIYNSDIFTNVSARGMLRNNGIAYTGFASGRFPFLLSADVTINSVTRRMNFILLHGKAGSTQQDYQRRQEGAKELKDTLDRFYAGTPTIIIGDFNDALYGTICTNCPSSLSSYDPIIKDSTDADHYRSITLPLGVDGQSSMTNFPNVVDNHVISDEAYPSYVPYSARILTDVTSLVANYSNTTSDHYPVFSQYNLVGIVTGITNVPAEVLGIIAAPNPFRDQLSIVIGKQLKNVSLRLFDATGKLIREEERKLLSAGSFIHWPLTGLTPGPYYLQVQTKDHGSMIKLLQMK